MENHRSLIVLICVATYMAMCIGVGIWAMRRTKNTHDFFMAGRHLGVIVAGVAVFSSTMSGWGFVGGPGLVYKMGTSSFWMIVCTSLAMTITFFLLGKRLRLLAELRDPISLPDAVHARYDSRTTSLLTAVAILLGVMGYLATQILAMATVLQSILENVSWVGPLPIEVCVAISSTVLVFYCVTGGIIASVYTDLVQGIIMVIAAVLILATAVFAVDGGLAGMSRTIMVDDPEAMSPWGTLGMIGCLSWYFIFVLGACGQPHVITKLMMTRRVEDARHMLPVSVVGYGVSALLWIGIGLAMRALVLQGTHPELTNADDAAAEFLQNYAHPLLSGVVFAGLLAAIMSTADSFLNIGAAAVVHDIPRSLRGRSLRNELFWARTATVVIAAMAAGFALMSGDLVALLGAFGWSTFAAAIVPTVAIGFNWKRATPLACNIAIVSGLLINFGLKLFGIALPHGFHGGAFSLLVSLTLFFVVSMMSPRKALPSDIEAVMDV
ncbi:MAG: sodium/proline symporter [Fuerstiella sp.]